MKLKEKHMMSHNSHCRNESLTLVINSKSCLTVQWVIKFSLSSIFSFNTEVILRATLNSTCLQLTCISLRIPFLFHLTLLQPLSKVTFLLQMMKLWAFTSFECSYSNDTHVSFRLTHLYSVTGIDSYPALLTWRDAKIDETRSKRLCLLYALRISYFNNC